MKRLLLVFTLLLTACAPVTPADQTAAPSPAAPAKSQSEPPSSSSKPPSDAEALPFDYAELQEAVRIQLDDQPRLHSPIQSVVTPAPQRYTLFFKSDMDRTSVEEALLQRAKDAKKDRPEYVLPSLSFRWANDRQLRLTVTVPPGERPDYGARRYLLDVKGAKTKLGETLADPPTFLAVLYAPNQLWRVSADGKQKDQLSSFTEPYFTQQYLEAEQPYLLLSRFIQYCECDANYERMYAVYDVNERKLVPYPLPLETSYMGDGDFVADRRGFFYAKPDGKNSIPPSNTAVSLRVAEYIHGAVFSKDRRHLIMAVGRKQQTGDFDLVIRNLDSGHERRLPKALKGTAPQNELTGSAAPIHFQDNGEIVTFAMRKAANIRKSATPTTGKQEK